LLQFGEFDLSDIIDTDAIQTMMDDFYKYFLSDDENDGNDDEG